MPQAHTPKSVIAENFHLAPEVFDHIPKSEKYIFQGSNPGPISMLRPRGMSVMISMLRFSHNMLALTPANTTGGQVRITDSSNFPVSKTVAAARVVIQPGALRALHWHPN